MRTISRIASSYMSRVISGSVMPKPPISVVDDPATGAELEAAVGDEVHHRDALGDARRVVHRRRDVDDPRRDVDVLRAGEHPRHERLARGDVRVLLQEVVLGEPGVLPVVLVADLAELDLAHEPVVLGVRVLRGEVLVYEAALEQAEFHDPQILRRRRSDQRF